MLNFFKKKPEPKITYSTDPHVIKCKNKLFELLEKTEKFCDYVEHHVHTYGEESVEYFIDNGIVITICNKCTKIILKREAPPELNLDICTFSDIGDVRDIIGKLFWKRQKEMERRDLAKKQERELRLQRFLEL